MTVEFDDDSLGGSGFPTVEQVVKLHGYLKSRNRSTSTRKMADELEARGFTIGSATVGRILKEAGLSTPPHKKSEKNIKKAENRVNAHRHRRKKMAAAEPVAAAAMLLPPEKVAEIASLAALMVNDNSSTSMAIRENRTRMALNIIVMELMAAKPELMLIDMRGSAALIDALTVATKLSGGASIDVTVPNPGAVDVQSNGNGHDISPNGHTMKDITPVKGPLSDELDAFRRKRDAERGQRT